MEKKLKLGILLLIVAVVILVLIIKFNKILENNENKTVSNNNSVNLNIETIEEQLKEIKILKSNDYEMYVYETIITDAGPDYANPNKIEDISDINKIVDILNIAIQYNPNQVFDYNPKHMLEIRTKDSKYRFYFLGNTLNTKNSKNLIVFEYLNSKVIYQIDGNIDLEYFYNKYKS